MERMTSAREATATGRPIKRHRDGMLTEILEAARAGRNERQVEVSESRRQVQCHFDPRQERCIAGKVERRRQAADDDVSDCVALERRDDLGGLEAS